MSGDKTPSRPVPIPSGRVGRALRLGGMAAGIAGNMALGALGEAGRGSRPEMRRLQRARRGGEEQEVFTYPWWSHSGF